MYGLGFDREERYLRYFRAFFDVRGDMVRQRVLPRPQGLLRYVDHTPNKPGGISASVISEFCQLVGCPCHVVHTDSKIYEWMPADYATWPPHRIRDTPRIMLNVHSITPSFTTAPQAGLSHR